MEESTQVLALLYSKRTYTEVTQLYQFYTVQYEKQVEESAQVVEVLREPTEQLQK